VSAANFFSSAMALADASKILSRMDSAIVFCAMRSTRLELSTIAMLIEFFDARTTRVRKSGFTAFGCRSGSG